MTTIQANSESGIQVAIVADDLTGALDAAAPFAARGMQTVVAIGAAAVGRALRMRPQVISVSTASREISEDVAFSRVAATLAELPSAPWLFKKVDSRLKGHVKAELDAFPTRRALIAPAIPDFGRIVRNGYVEGFGVDTRIDVAAQFGTDDGTATIPDTATQDEMRDALRGWGEGLLVGARGLADALAEQLTHATAVLISHLPGPRALFVIGSRDPITITQVQHLREAGVCHWLPAPGGVVGKPWPDQGSLIVQAVAGPKDVSAEVVAAGLAQAVADRIPQYATTLLTGGATAEAVFERAGIDVLGVRGECLPGLAVAEADGRSFVTKSGGFGQSDSLQQIFAMLGSGVQG